MSTNPSLKTYQYEINLLENYFSKEEIWQILSHEPSKEDIISYYKWCRWAYKRYVSKEGHMHFAIDDDFDAHVKIMMSKLEEINPSEDKTQDERTQKAFLEIGAGNGTNSIFLAKHFSEHCFFSSDLMNKGKNIRLSNYSHKTADFHYLDIYKDDFFQVVFGIETLCHSPQKAVVLEECHKKLQKGGLMFIFDGYANQNKEELSKQEKYALELMEKGMTLYQLDSVSYFDDVISESDFELIEKIDFSKEVQSFAKYLYERSIFFLTDNSLKYRTIRRFLPKSIAKNVATGLLTYPMLKSKHVGYYLHILQK